MTKKYQYFADTQAVVSALKAACDKRNKANERARTTLWNNGVVVWPEELKYRTFAGPFKVSRGVFESRAFYFDPVHLYATSYTWWKMLLIVKGKLVRNSCHYSRETARHQRKLDRILDVLGITPDITVSTRANIADRESWKRAVLEDYADAVLSLKYCRPKTRAWRKRWLTDKTRELARLEKAKVGLRFSKRDKEDAVARAEQERRKELDWQKERKKREQERQIAVNAPVAAVSPVAPITHLKLV